ncbi:MAG: hypothetical protein OXG39_16380 [Chloroflexi bacterium]|nr:hypothetical protein [Chloroflexota bacterium]
MEQKELNNKILKNENDISEIKGKWDSLATKEFVQEAINKQTKELRDEIAKGRDWRNKIIGGGTALVLLVTVLANLFQPP